jgi:hypothetical protein
VVPPQRGLARFWSLPGLRPTFVPEYIDPDAASLIEITVCDPGLAEADPDLASLIIV